MVYYGQESIVSQISRSKPLFLCRTQEFVSYIIRQNRGVVMQELHLFLIIACLISAGLFALSCTKSFLSVCKLKKGCSAVSYFAVSALIAVILTIFGIYSLHCRFFVPLILVSQFVLSMIFTDGLVRMRYYSAGIHAFLFTAARTLTTELLSLITNRVIPVFSSDSWDSLVLPVTVLTISFLLSCLFERAALNACKVDGVRGPEFSPKMLTYLCIAVTLFLAFTMCESGMADSTAAGVRAFALSHLCLCLLLYGGIWLLIRYHATVTHISETKKTDSRRREERYYNYYSAQAKTLEEMRRFRHDYKNQLSGLKVLIDSGEYERASEYLSAIAGRFDGMSKNTASYSDNMLADAVLQSLARRCESIGATFSGRLSIGNEIPLADPEFCTVLSNLADNAFEAVQKVSEGERFISFSGSRRVKWLTITAENSYDGIVYTDRDGIVTRKEDRVLHGLGLKSITAIVESVPGASIRIEPLPEEKIFRVTILFPRTQSGDNSDTSGSETSIKAS